MASGNGDEGPQSLWALGARWLFGQEATVVLLFAIVLGGFYAFRTLVPIHLSSIQQGYEKIDKAHEEATKTMRLDHGEQVKSQRDSFAEIVSQQNETLKAQGQTYEKSLSRIADSFDKTMDRALQQVEAQP
jgi:hypothetical protein